jgi:large subunit ribosomal protein L10
MVTQMAHVAQWKGTEVDDLIKIMSTNPVIGLVNVKGIPGPQLQKMRQNLYNKAIFRISKIKLLSLAFKELEPKVKGIKGLNNALEGQVGLIATDMNPFKLFRLLEESKTPAPVKGGEIAPDDIEIKEGETSFKPGPIVGELQRVGIPAAIEQGKVVIKSDRTIIKAGETISQELAQMLTRLQIYPLLVGLDLQAVLENGTVFQKSDLDVDPKQFIEKLSLAANYGFNLAFNINYPTHSTILPMLQTAHDRAMNLVFNAWIITPESIDFMINKGFNQMLSLASNLKPEALDDELKEKIGVSAPSLSAKEPAEKPSEAAEDKAEEDKKKSKKKEAEKEVSEEEAASGLSQMFD